MSVREEKKNACKELQYNEMGPCQNFLDSHHPGHPRQHLMGPCHPRQHFENSHHLRSLADLYTVLISF